MASVASKRQAEDSNEESTLKKPCNQPKVTEADDATEEKQADHDDDDSQSLDNETGETIPPRNVVGVIGKSLLYPTLEELGLALPMDLAAAQKASIFRRAGFLKVEEASKLVTKFQRLRLQPYTNNSDLDYDADGNAIHCTYYLNDRGLFRQKFFGLRNRVLALARQANEEQKWGMDMSKVSIRVAEFHDYRQGGSLPEKDHYDKGSLVTVDIMLEEADDGGEFQTSAGESAFEKHAFRVGDALVFPSHKYHSVSPVLQGLRRVMVVEVWSGQERTCGHRCELLEGECDFDADSV